MCEVDNNIKLSWLLVSQFVSWDFCRYMCEQNENKTWEPDVLTFLRNMVVERTEKAASDITMHEMVARFVMEARTIRTVARMPFIRELSKKVEEKCPELKSSMAELLFELERLLNSLEQSEERSKVQEQILINMAREVNKFNVEACKSLPLPNILQVIRTWLQIEYQAQLLKDNIKKNVENVELFQRVVDCLHEEKITSEEAKAIARALYEDKSLKKIFLLNNSETETEIDSQSQSLSLRPYQVPPKQLTPPQSMHVSSHRRLPSPVHRIEHENTSRSFTFNPTLSPSNHQELPELSLHDSFNPSSPEEPIEDVQQYKVSNDMQDLRILTPLKSYRSEFSTEAQTSTSDSSTKPQTNTRDSYTKPQTNTRNSYTKPQTISRDSNRNLPTSTRDSNTKPTTEDPDPISLCTSDSDSSELTSASNTFRNKRNWKKFLEEFRLDEDFSEDSSPPVSKITEIPEMVEDVPVQNHFVSYDDEEDTSDCDKNTDFRFLTPTMFKSDYVEKNPAPAVVLSDNESFNSSITTAPADSQKDDPTFQTCCKTVPAKDSPILPAKKRLKTSLVKTHKTKPQSRMLSRITELPETTRQMTLRRFGFASTSTNSKNTALQKEPGKKTFKLFDNDVPITRSSDESYLFEKDLRNKKQKPQQKVVKTIDLGNKKRCEQCRKTFRTTTELKKHVFVVHTVEDLSDD